jgi:HPt (histidine-containing phosphotransfer) domain-containing protein
MIIKVDSDIYELIPQFLEHKRKNLKDIENALENNDLETVYQIAHKIKGSSGLYGLKEMSEIAKSLEFAGRNLEKEKATQYFNQLSNHLENLQIEKTD